MKPLEGIRVVDLSRVLAGPYCSLLMADMGAEVIKIEEPGHGDDTRAWPPFAGGEATYFMSVNRGKKSLTLDLKTEAGKEILRRLLASADVLLENFRPGTLARLGFGYEAARGLNPRLVYCSISGFGESGPEAGRPGYDLIVQGESGLMDLTGFPDGPPVKTGNSIADLAAGTMAAHGIVLALFARERTGAGQKVEVAMLEVMASLLTYQGQAYLSTGVSPRRLPDDRRRQQLALDALLPGPGPPRAREGFALRHRGPAGRAPRHARPAPRADLRHGAGGDVARAARAGRRAGGKDQVGRGGPRLGAPAGPGRHRPGEAPDGGDDADDRAADPPPRHARRGGRAGSAPRRAHGRDPDEAPWLLFGRGDGTTGGGRRLARAHRSQSQ